MLLPRVSALGALGNWLGFWKLYIFLLVDSQVGIEVLIFKSLIRALLVVLMVFRFVLLLTCRPVMLIATSIHPWSSLVGVVILLIIPLSILLIVALSLVIHRNIRIILR